MTALKKLIVLFVTLFGVFLCSWAYKIQSPVNPDAGQQDDADPDAGAWWNTGKIDVDDEWYLDPSIPANYIPVPGEDELYMVVDNDGNIISYKHRYKDANGNWQFEDVDPNIPDNYEKVPGLENVYKVVDEDGTVHYVKYIRNDDDTFAFVEVDANGNPIEHDDDATVIDGKHVHISGNIYSLLNDNGVVIGYENRVDNGDGTFSWQMADMSQLGNLPDIKLGDGSNGLTLQSPGMDNSALEEMARQMAAANQAAANGTGDTYNITINNTQASGALQAPDSQDPSSSIDYNDDGTHTVTEKHTRKVNIDGKTETYMTYTKIVYDSDGNEISRTSSPEELVSQEENVVSGSTETPNPDAKEDTLSKEFARVSGKMNYKDDIAQGVVSSLNAYRASKGKKTLQATENASLVAKLRAADMAKYNTSDSNLPTYGRLAAMLSYYQLHSQAPGETLWKSYVTTADEINTRFLAVDSARETRMKDNATEVGVGIVEKDGVFYICEVII